MPGTRTLRSCTPLFPLPSITRKVSDRTKSLYDSLVARKTLWSSLPDLPTIMPSRADQTDSSPSQPARSRPLNSGTNPAVSTTGGSPSSLRDQEVMMEA